MAGAHAATTNDTGAAMKPIATGEMRHRIEVWRDAVVPGQTNGLGADLVKPKNIGTFWAKVESRTGSLLKGRTADTVLTDTTHVVTLRYTDKIQPDCWIVFQGMRFDIDYVSDPDFTRTWLEVFCRGNWV